MSEVRAITRTESIPPTARVEELNFTFKIVPFFFVIGGSSPCRVEPKASLLPSACFSPEDSVKRPPPAHSAARHQQQHFLLIFNYFFH